MSELGEIAGTSLAELLGHPLVVIALRMLGGCLVILWLAIAWWVWRDAGARTRDPLFPYVAAAAVIVATPLLFLPAVVVYLVIRPPRTVSADEAAQLQHAILADEAAVSVCPACGAPVDPDWVACPACGADIAVRCVGCGRALGLDWKICAWCAADVPWAAAVATWDAEQPPMGDPVAIPIRPGGPPVLPVFPAPERRTVQAPLERRRLRGTRRTI